MNTNQVQCFVESARRLSFTGAATDMYLSPQAVSKQVISLEEELCVRLFDRNGPRLTLTEGGKMFFNLYTALGRQLNFMLDDIRLYLKSLQMGLSIGVSEWLDPSGEFFDGITAFRTAVPTCKVSMSMYPNVELLSALDEGLVDCAFFSGAQRPQGSDYISRIVAFEDVTLYAPSDTGTGQPREDCWGLPLLMVSAWNWSHVELRVAGAREMTGVRLSPTETVQLPNVQSMYAQMEYSRCATLGGSRFSYLAKIPGLTGHPIGIKDEIYCVWLRKNENILSQQLAEQLRIFFGTPEDA
jgi:DNA-binding transcriptional LysR family regulator